MSATQVDAEHFDELFEGIERSSWRWECQGYYAIDQNQLQRWRVGQGERGTPDDLAWRTYIQGLRSRGIPFERVRMLTEPLTDYLRYQLDTTDWNIESGEDIRWISQSTAGELGLPDYDYYIFDDNRVLIFRFDDAKNLLGVDVDDDPDVVQRHQTWRATVWPRATAHAEYRITQRHV
jgi:hypothetical protein